MPFLRTRRIYRRRGSRKTVNSKSFGTARLARWVKKTRVSRKGAKSIARKAIEMDKTIARHTPLPSFRVAGNGSSNYPLLWMPQMAGRISNVRITNSQIVCQPNGDPLPGYVLDYATDPVDATAFKSRAATMFAPPIIKTGQLLSTVQPMWNEPTFFQNYFGITLNPWYGTITDPERLDKTPHIKKVNIDLQVIFPSLSEPVAATDYVPRILHYEIIYLPESRWNANATVTAGEFPYTQYWGTATTDTDAGKLSLADFQKQQQGIDVLYDFTMPMEKLRWVNPSMNMSSYNQNTYGGFGTTDPVLKSISFRRMYPKWKKMKRYITQTVEPNAYRPERPQRS